MGIIPKESWRIYPKEKYVLCLSGGIDSVIAWYYLNQPKAVYFNTGVPSTQKELNALNNLGIPYIEDHSLKINSGEIYIPHRNLLFASRASTYNPVVFMAGLADDMVEDKTEEAFSVMSKCLSFIGKEDVFVYSPFWRYTKDDLVLWFMANNGHAESILRIASSCYSDTEHQCMECPACFRKASALFNVGIKLHFSNDALLKEYYEKAVNGYYHPRRNESIINYCKWRING